MEILKFDSDVSADERLRVALAQISPVFLNRDATIAKVVENKYLQLLIREAISVFSAKHLYPVTHFGWKTPKVPYLRALFSKNGMQNTLNKV